MVSSRKSNKEVFEAEVLESSVIDEGVLKKILLKAGRAIALPALEGLELIMDNSTPPQVKISIMGANKLNKIHSPPEKMINFMFNI